MTTKTHITTAIALSTLIIAPATFKLSIINIVATTIGSVTPDIDISTSHSHKELVKVSLIILITLLIGVSLDYTGHFGILNLINKQNELYKSITYILLFLSVCTYGMKTPHRTFMHSVLAVIILSSLVYFFFKPAFLSFFIGITSHIFLDLFNRKKIQLLYPYKKKYFFNLCSSNGLINDSLFIISIFIFILT